MNKFPEIASLLESARQIGIATGKYSADMFGTLYGGSVEKNAVDDTTRLNALVRVATKMAKTASGKKAYIQAIEDAYNDGIDDGIKLNGPKLRQLSSKTKGPKWKS